MQIISPPNHVLLGDPIKLMACFAEANDWPLRDLSKSEILVEISGKWSDYLVSLAWQDSKSVLHISIDLDVVVVRQQLEAMREVIASINSRSRLGHFDLLSRGSDSRIIFRYNLPLRQTGGTTPEQIEDILDSILSECERAYPAFVQIAFGETSPTMAITTAMMEPQGSA